jgi:hypothetical protein
MPKVCASRNLSITDGVLGIAKWSAPRLVAQQTATSTGDGTITSAGLTSQPGRLMIDTSVSWTSDSPLASVMRLQVIRKYRTLIASNPNAVQIWDSWNVGIDKAAVAPDSYNLVNSLTTLSWDMGTDQASQPFYARIHQHYPATASEEWYDLPAGSSIQIKYRAYCWTPPPWSNNASANNPLHEAWARGVTLRLWAFPTLDEAVR